jgi:hypothetical protein
MLLRIDREHLATPSFGQLFSDFFEELSFLRIELLFGKIACLGDDESNIVLNFGIELCAIERS